VRAHCESAPLRETGVHSAVIDNFRSTGPPATAGTFEMSRFSPLLRLVSVGCSLPRRRYTHFTLEWGRKIQIEKGK
jgi:hypothetical protein